MRISKSALEAMKPAPLVTRDAVTRELRAKLSGIQDHRPLGQKTDETTRYLEKLISMIERGIPFERWAVETQRILGRRFEVKE